MKNVKLNPDEYIINGLGDIYFSLISFIGNYVEKNYNPFDIDDKNNSEYANVLISMKKSLKEILDFLIITDEVFIPSLNRTVNLKKLNIIEQKALEERCKEYILIRLSYYKEVLEDNKQKSRGK